MGVVIDGAIQQAAQPGRQIFIKNLLRFVRFARPTSRPGAGGGGRFAPRIAWRPAWINDLQRGGLENGVNRLSPGRPLVERLLARLPEEGLFFRCFLCSSGISALKEFVTKSLRLISRAFVIEAATFVTLHALGCFAFKAKIPGILPF